MNSSKNLAAIAALAIAAGLAGAGCMANGADADESTDGQDQLTALADQTGAVTTEKTGTASEKCGLWGGGLWGGGLWGGGFGGCGLWGGGFPFWGGLGGCGWGGGWGGGWW